MSCTFRSKNWSSQELLHAVMPSAITRSFPDKKEYEPILWNDLCSEYDAENFSAMVDSSVIKKSEDFLNFKQLWKRDKYNHIDQKLVSGAE